MKPRIRILFRDGVAYFVPLAGSAPLVSRHMDDGGIIYFLDDGEFPGLHISWAAFRL